MLFRFGRSKTCFHVVAAVAFTTILTGVVMGQEKLVVKSHSKPYPTFGKLESKDPRFDKLISPGTKMEKLGEGFEWCEGPLWSKEGGFLLFSDIPRNSVMKWKDGEGVSLYMYPSGYTGIVRYTAEGAGLECQHVRFARPAHTVRAWRPADFGPHQRWRQTHAGRQLSRQAAEQPERFVLRLQRRFVLHRSDRTGCREHENDPPSRNGFLRCLSALEGWQA